MITQQIIYWIMSTFQNIKINGNRFKQINRIRKPRIKAKINFIGRLTRNEGAIMFFIIEKS